MAAGRFNSFNYSSDSLVLYIKACIHNIVILRFWRLTHSKYMLFPKWRVSFSCELYIPQQVSSVCFRSILISYGNEWKATTA